MNNRPTIAISSRIAPRIFALAGLVAACAMLSVAPASADFRLCNNTTSRVGIAIGYKDKDGWATEGWWNLAGRSGCEILLRGTLSSRYYYIYAVDYDRGGEWSGQAFMCTRDKEFIIRGTNDCLARGFDRTGFLEVDTSESADWTVQLTESGETKAGPNSPAMQPPAPGRQNPAQPSAPAQPGPAPR